MQQGTKSLDGALKLLGFFIPHRREWRVTDLAQAAGLHKSQVSRILRTFEAYGFLEKNDNYYELGRAFTTYATLVKTERSLVEVARPIMERLSKETQATVMLKAREQEETVTIDRVESRHFLRLAYPVGLRLPLNASSSGKVFLAYMSPEDRSRLYRTGCFRKLTRRTKTKLAPLERDISLVLRKGFAVSDEEHLLGARGIAAPIFNAGGAVEATLALGLPTVLLPGKMIEQVGISVRRAAEEISSLLNDMPRRSYTHKNPRMLAVRR